MSASSDTEATWHGLSSPGGATQGIEGATVASAATIALVRYITTVSGVAAISLITLPYEGFAGTVAVIPSGIFTLATGGVATSLNKPVGLAATSVVGKVLFLTYSPAAGLWYPSYTA